MATARQFDVTQEDIDSEGGAGGAYAEIEVPGDYQVTLTEVEDYDKRDKGKSHGWIFVYEVETPSGATVDFRIYASFGKKARWKLLEVLEAHSYDIEAGINDVDPDAFIGDVVGATIDFPRDDDGEPDSKYREITAVFDLAEAPEGEAEEAEIL